LSINAVHSALFSRIFRLSFVAFRIYSEILSFCDARSLFHFMKCFSTESSCNRNDITINSCAFILSLNIFRSVMTISVFLFGEFFTLMAIVHTKICARSPVFLNMLERYLNHKNTISNTVL
jgi:hypothetical protein